MVLPSSSSNNFLLDSYRDENGSFPLGATLISSTFTTLKMPINDNGSQYCLTGQYVKGASNVQLSPADCLQNFAVVCRMVASTAPNCSPGSSTFVKQSPLSLFIDPALQV